MRCSVEGVGRVIEYRLRNCILSAWICVAALKALAGEYGLRCVGKRAPQKKASSQKHGEKAGQDPPVIPSNSDLCAYPGVEAQGDT
jgi:hypothetical protein